MVAKVITSTVIGLEAYKIEIEVDILNSLPAVSIVGLPDAAVSEARERVKSAIKNSGYLFPNKKVVVNLAPADIKKEGTNYDLPIALGILAQDGVLDCEKFKEYVFVGELSLDGSLRPINGILPIVSGLKELGLSKIVVPKENSMEAALIPEIEVYPANNLNEVVNHFLDDETIAQKIPQFKINVEKYFQKETEIEYQYDFKDVKGQQKAKLAMEIAAAGGHNLLMSGSPGAGKTLLSKCFMSILPPLELEEAIELTKIYSISGLLKKDNPLITVRPFRSVHHSASAVGIIGGGTSPKPGEITLAHRGVLFLDEIVEFPRNVLEVLRQPLEDGEVVISRVHTSIKYPADFMLLAAMNPCPCGYLGDKQKQCTCTQFQIDRYNARLSGPLLDRIDLHIDVQRLSAEELINMKPSGETSKDIRERVIKARKIQKERYKNEGILTNSQLTPKLIKKYCVLDEKSKELLKAAVVRFELSGRAYDRILKLSRTIADINGVENIEASHIAQALQYRMTTKEE